jgi:selenide,water dikinase
VDDAFTWGQIAAANAASDVYAMGGRPIVALNIAGWPRDTLPLELLADVLRGGRSVAERGGFLIVGGHTIDDPEPKYGMVVVGRADPQRLMTIDAARPGDVLVLTKPIGTGIVTTAIKADAAPASVVDAAVESMTRLNDTAAKAFAHAGIRACTDVTGFGLLGHLQRMLAASGVGARIDAAAVPLLAGVRELAERGNVPGGTKRNLEAAEPFVEWGSTDEITRTLLCDAQTSGGLLGACAPDAADALVTALSGELAAAVIGRIVDGPSGRISVS